MDSRHCVAIELKYQTSKLEITYPTSLSNSQIRVVAPKSDTISLRMLIDWKI